MTFSELLEEVMGNVSLAPNGQRVQRAEAKRLMNLAMREISLRLGIPTLYVVVPTTAGAFQLPLRVHPEGVKYAEVVEVEDGEYGVESMRNQRIPIMSIREANEFYPRWEDDEDAPYCGPAFLVHSAAQPDTGFRPVGLTSASYRFYVHANPEPMVEDSDEPFAVIECDSEGNESRRPGAMPAYHRVLAHHVSYELLQRLGSEQWQAFYARYREMEAEMFSQVQPTTVYLPSSPRLYQHPRSHRSRYA